MEVGITRGEYVAMRTSCVIRVGRFVAFVLLVSAMACLGGQVQSLSLQTGWNSVWLEVTPAAGSPGAVFGGTSVDIVAGYFPAVTTVQFIADPAEEPWKHPGWGVWYAPNRPEAALSNLGSVDGGRAYLIHAVSDATLQITGEPVCLPLRWYANSFNFVGLPVDPDSPPSLAEFFAGSAAHASLRLYRLVDGSWRKVAAPASVSAARGTAYWVYCTGRSEWQGPMEVQLNGISGIDLGTDAAGSEVKVINRSAEDLGAVLTSVAGDLPLCTESLDAETLEVSYPPLTDALDLGTLGAQTAVAVRLHVRRELMTAPAQEAVLTVRGGGCLSVVPVRASRGTP